MSVTFKLPPSGRNFEVFEAVIVGGKSTREAAEQFRLSQSRVCQVVKRMQAWLAEVLASEHLTDEQQLRLAKSIAGHRLSHLYCEIMSAWRSSQGEFKQTRNSYYGDEVITTKRSCGDPKYVIAATRLIKAAAELGVASSLPYPDDDEEEPGRPEARPTDAHPVEDCSQNGQGRPIPATPATEPSAATAAVEPTFAALTPEQHLERRRLLAPVQHDHVATMGSSQSGIQLELTPDQSGASTRPLNRQQRRRLQRALRRK